MSTRAREMNYQRGNWMQRLPGNGLTVRNTKIHTAIWKCINPNVLLLVDLYHNFLNKAASGMLHLHCSYWNTCFIFHWRHIHFFVLFNYVRFPFSQSPTLNISCALTELVFVALSIIKLICQISPCSFICSKILWLLVFCLLVVVTLILIDW